MLGIIVVQQQKVALQFSLYIWGEDVCYSIYFRDSIGCYIIINNTNWLFYSEFEGNSPGGNFYATKEKK